MNRMDDWLDWFLRTIYIESEHVICFHVHQVFNFIQSCTFFICWLPKLFLSQQPPQNEISLPLLMSLLPSIHITILDHFSLNTTKKALNNIKSAIKVICFYNRQSIAPKIYSWICINIYIKLAQTANTHAMYKWRNCPSDILSSASFYGSRSEILALKHPWARKVERYIGWEN